jgi:hypothetical protein
VDALTGGPHRLARAAALLLGLLLALPARAVPPDARLQLSQRLPRIEKVGPEFTIALVDDPKVLRAELLPSGELLLEPAGPGVARVFLFAKRLVRVVEVAVETALPAPAPPPAGLCAAPVITEKCYSPWRERLAHLAAADAPRVSYELEGMQQEAKAAGALLAAAGLGHVQFSTSALGVRLKGAKDPAEKRAALRAVYGAVLGPLRFEE